MPDESRSQPTTAEQLIFDANLKEFGQRVGIVCSLEQGGKIDALDAYHRIKKLFKELKISKRALNLDAVDEQSPLYPHPTDSDDDD